MGGMLSCDAGMAETKGSEKADFDEQGGHCPPSVMLCAVSTLRGLE
jgi:hypothetical protein